ncbi:xylose isomerase [Sphaerotilus natans subsp. natans DSM 6575]|uniref:Xylose isomerase n=1 Tax=Sphaerotilus natans subsp. natans DSM 6575 TaxID=1286631 RepID=A0A059KHL0_9BURK|nr:myo-inosose-2 dehydratase [Sphaerotilus natans]KDB50952.1 xylose isomerase [Sphaerotilus natans subsp. natans DSM 6575]SIR04827.1 2-keto-myo-inositol dehydratase [Sphaerotilus natans]
MSWNVRIGINPLSWMNDDLPSLGGETPLETALSEGREIGYAGFELGNKFPKDGPGLKAKLDEFGLVCVSGWYSGFLAEVPAGQTDAQAVAAEIERAQAHLRKLQYNGVKVVVYGECAGTIQGQIDTPVAKRPKFKDEAAWAGYAARLNAFGQHLIETYGIKLAYHHHMGAYVESPADVDKLMALTDPAKVFLLFDTGHAYFGGAADPVTVLKKHVGRVVHVHCKDVRAQVIAKARNESWSFLNGVINGTFTVPGDGVIDYDAVLSTLHDAGYEGWLVVEAEQDPAVAPSYEYAKKGYDTLRAIVDRIDATAV